MAYQLVSCAIHFLESVDFDQLLINHQHLQFKEGLGLHLIFNWKMSLRQTFSWVGHEATLECLEEFGPKKMGGIVFDMFQSTGRRSNTRKDVVCLVGLELLRGSPMV